MLLLTSILGQTVLTDFRAATQTVTKQKKDGSWSFVIPRFFNGGTIIGGTKQPGDWSTDPNLSTRESLLSEGRKIAGFASGSSVDSDVIKVITDVVGRRPTREGGMRIEVEQPKAEANETRRSTPIVHAYGAGGRGYEISWGVAEDVAKLVEVVLSERQQVIQAKL